MIKKIIDLKEDTKFTIQNINEFKGIIKKHSEMGTTVFFISIPDHWHRKYYNENTMKNKEGEVYQELDTFYYRKKMMISSSTMVEI